MRKNKILLLIILIMSINFLKSQEMIPDRGLLSKVFRITFDGKTTGTCFFVNHETGNYLITAKHLLTDKGQGLSDGQIINFRLFKDSVWIEQNGIIKFHTNKDIDIAAIHLKTTQKRESHYLLNSNYIKFFTDALMLGFPFGIHFSGSEKDNYGFPLPLVKKGIISGQINIDGVEFFVLDAFNNKGFSGGPVFTKSSDGWHLLGVIMGYVHENQKFGNDTIFLNTGLTLVTNVNHLIEIFNRSK